jgi:hypothetical protein
MIQPQTVSTISEIGNAAVPAAVVLLLLKEVFAFIKTMRSSENGNGAKKVEAVAELLLQDDDDKGSKRWNVKPYAKEICEKVEGHERASGERHLRIRKTLDEHTESLNAIRLTNELLATTNKTQTEILRDLKDIIKRNGNG